MREGRSINPESGKNNPESMQKTMASKALIVRDANQIVRREAIGIVSARLEDYDDPTNVKVYRGAVTFLLGKDQKKA